MVATAPDRLSDLRDHALLLIGFAGAFRCSELVALDVADIDPPRQTDREALGRTIAITRGDVACPGRSAISLKSASTQLQRYAMHRT